MNSFLVGMLRSTSVIESRIGMDLKHSTVYQDWFHNAPVFVQPEMRELRITWGINTYYGFVYTSIEKIYIFSLFLFHILNIIRPALESLGYVWKITTT